MLFRSKKAMGFVTTRSSVIAIAFAIVVWLTALTLNPGTYLFVVVFGFFATLALEFLFAALANRSHWPAQAMFLWAQGPRPNWNPAEDKDRLVDRANWAIVDGHDEASWQAARTIASELPADIRRVHALAMIDLFESAHFDEEAYEAAAGAVTNEAEGRYWRVQFAVTRAFAAYQTGGDYMKPMLEVSRQEGPFVIATPSRVRVWIARVGFPIFFLTVGVVAGVVMAISGGR